MTLLEGITARTVETGRLVVGVLERDGATLEPVERTVVLLHGSVGSSLFWQPAMLALPQGLRVIAIDLRGYGRTEQAPVDATRGVRDFSDDVYATLQSLKLETAHLVGWELGAAVALQYALDHPVLSLTLESPVSPYGFGGTRLDGTRLTDDDAGVGGGAVSADFVERLANGDESAEAPTSPRSVFRDAYVGEAYTTRFEDVWVDAMLSTSTATATGNYPGDTVASDTWPGYAAGDHGVMNALAPKHFDVSSIVDLDPKPPILWVRGDADVIISDASCRDINQLGACGALAGWPGSEIAPAQPMVAQTRAVLDAYRAAGGVASELVFAGVGHAPHLEEAEEFRAALLQLIRYFPPSSPPTEAIILRSSD